jgi:hypothetical protein
VPDGRAAARAWRGAAALFDRSDLWTNTTSDGVRCMTKDGILTAVEVGADHPLRLSAEGLRALRKAGANSV